MSFTPPKVSGAVLLDQVKVMVELAGKEYFDAAVEALQPKYRDEFRSLMPVSWCSVDTANALMEGVAQQVGRKTSAFQADVVRTGVERTFKTLWRILLRLTTDEALVRRTPMLYSKTYDRGELVSQIVRPGRAEIELRGWPAPPQLDLEGLATGIETVLKVAGRESPRVSFERRPEGAFYVASWSV